MRGQLSVCNQEVASHHAGLRNNCSQGLIPFNLINTLRPIQNGRHFADDIFKRIFLNKYIWISINISLKFVPMCPIDNIPALVKMMAWRRPGDKPITEPMVVSLMTHICVTRHQWVKKKYHCLLNSVTQSLFQFLEQSDLISSLIPVQNVSYQNI